MKLTISLALAFLTACAATASAAVVVTIDISNPAATVITALPVNSAINGDLYVNFNGGISFLNFFTADESITVAAPLGIAGTWTAAGTASSYNEMVTFDYGSADVVPGVDLSIYNSLVSNADDQNFTTATFAFTGSSTVNLSGFANLPAAGTTGSVNLGYMSSQGGSIGQWQVIPEPASCGLAALGAVAAFLRRRR